MSPYCARAIWTDLRRRCFTNRVRDNHGHHTFDKACTKKTARCTKYIHCFERSCHVLSIAINCVNEAYQSLPAFTMPYLWISWKFMEYLWSEHILAIWAYLSYLSISELWACLLSSPEICQSNAIQRVTKGRPRPPRAGKPWANAQHQLQPHSLRPVRYRPYRPYRPYTFCGFIWI